MKCKNCGAPRLPEHCEYCGVRDAPRATFVVPAGTAEDFEKMWQQANVRNYPFLPFGAATLIPRRMVRLA